jgi:putative membrane protein
MTEATFKCFLLPYLRPDYLLIGAWIASMIVLPILLWTVGDSALVWATSFSVILLAVAVITILKSAWGLNRALLTAFIVVLMGWLIEWLGSNTGFPFGSYSYTERMQPQIGDVPLLIPLAWLMMLPPAWAVAQSILGSIDSPFRRAAFVLLSALAFTAWDLFLDPQMVNWGFWEWHESNALNYLGIPLVNYFGWLLAALLMTAVIRPLLLPRHTAALLLLIYGMMIFLQTIGLGVFWGMPAAAIAGCCAMSLLFVPALRKFLT